jgi:glycosidase
MRRLASLAALLLLSAAALADDKPAVSQNYLRRSPQDEIVYLIMPDRFENGDRSNDRGGMRGDRLVTGYDPTDKTFYHGGDLKGVLKRLDYIQGLGATALWLTPVFKNKTVEHSPGHDRTGYHGYWITDFLHVDPHLGSDADLKALIAAVHARGMKFYMDIVVNHTADVIQYRECPDGDCPYRSRADYPYARRPNGAPINDGFGGDDDSSTANFAKLTSPDYAYTPYLPKGTEHAKNPDWLNNPLYYHNRGNSTFSGESSTMGDFFGLDDVFTEHPRVIQGFIDIYGSWIDKYHVDGFRIDTEKHVSPVFWQHFIPAMQARAKAAGIANFHIFGEVMQMDPDVALQARRTREDKLPAVMDYAFAAAVRQTVAGRAGTDVLARLFADDVLYEGGAEAALGNETLLGNYDIGRFPWFIRTAFPAISDDELMQRDLLATAMLFTLRGSPVIDYGDEQGFPSTGNDHDAREDLFASKVALYDSEKLLGTASTTANANFNPSHPIYRAMAALAALRKQYPALARGRQVVRAASDQPGLFAVSRIDPASGREIVIAFNTATVPLEARIEVDAAAQSFASLHGTCAAAPEAPASYRVRLAPLDYVICAAK